VPLEIEAFLARHRGFESPGTYAPIVVDRRLDDAKEATKDDETRRGVSASGPATTEEAIRVAAKVAIDAGDFGRALTFIELLHHTPRPVVAIVADDSQARRRAR
jgi:hypothetical protein